MASECIHGLDEGMCGTCFPRQAPEQVARPSSPRPTTASAPRPTRQGSSSLSKPPTQKPPTNLAIQRILHLTHIRNLESILETGEVLADATPPVDLSSELTRELRRTAEVSPGRSVADFVPFFLSPNATQWGALRNGELGTHWSRHTLEAAPSDFVVLAAPFGAVASAAVVTDGDAAGSLTRFATTPSEGERMLRLLLSDELTLLAAEVLVPERVSFETISLIGVANDRARDLVRDMLASRGFTTKVAVYPPWFQPSEA